VIGITGSRERAAQVSSVLDQVIECPPDERTARLDELCAGDAALRQMVESVLGHDVPDETPFRAAIGAALEVAANTVVADANGQRLGPYRIVQEIGRGGMGAVYLAVRDDQEFDQQVALKVVRGLLASDSVRRFRAERQILATLAHPNIGRLLDGGTTPDGVPYFVMEHVDGVPIDRYCQAQRLPLRERLRLFLKVCDAVAYAHGRLVVHRDLKPTNILVTQGGEPKLLDFGIATLMETGDDAGGQSVASPLTGAMAHLLTPEYASPEQIRGERVTTASDVYSLGVLLYELLADARPYQFQNRRADEMARVVCEVLPERPSVRSGRRELDGDLDTIVLAALEKDPARRLSSVDALAQEIRRHLAGEPILSRPSTPWYRAGRFVRRHRIGVAAAASIVALLAGWGVTVSIQARRIAQERDTAKEVTAFLVDLFASSDPFEARSAGLTARALVDKGAARLPELRDRPAIHAQLLEAVGKVYRSLGESGRASELLGEAMTIGERLGVSGPATATTLNELAEALRENGRFEDAEPLYRRALAIREQAFGPRSVEAAHSQNNLGLLLRARGQNDEAAAKFADAVAIWKQALGPRHPQVAVGLSNQSLMARDLGKFADAERLVREALEIRVAALGEVHPQTANSLMALGQTLNLAGRNREAEAPMARALEIRRKIYGANNSIVDASIGNLASLRQDLGDLDGAEALYREALSNQRRLGRHLDVAVTANNLASLLEERRSYAEAETLFRESLSIREERYGAKHAAVARATHNLARLLMAAGKLAEAEPLARDALSLRRELLGEKHFETGASMVLVAKGRAAHGERAAAEQMMRDALALTQSAVPAGHPAVIAAQYELGRLLLDAGRRAESEPFLRQAAESRATRLPEGHWLRVETDAALARARSR
jgi:tetratricopeptide (TPR) repeat protein